MNMLPTVSVAMPVLNRVHFISEALVSLQAQTLTDWELVVSDAGSRDGTFETLTDCAAKDQRIRVFRHSALGIAAARNTILKEARGEFLAVLDSDDLAKPERLEKQVTFLQASPSMAGTGSDIDFIDDDGRVIQAEKYKQRLTDPTELRRRQREGWNCFIHSSMMLRRSELIHIGGYREVFRHAEDDDLFLRLFDHRDLANMPDKLVSFRCHAENASRPGRVLHRVVAVASAHLRLAGLRDTVDDRHEPLDAAFLWGA